MVQEIHDFENANGDKSLRVTENYPSVEHFWAQAGHEEAQGPLYIRVNANGERAGIALSFEEARSLVDGIESILAKVEAAEPKIPSRAERWEAAPIGAVVTPNGSKPVGISPYRVKVGPDAWVSKYPEDGINHEREFHESWDLVKEEK